MNTKTKPLSKAALDTLKTAATRVPPYVLPLKTGIQGIAAKALLASLRNLGYIDPSEAPKITDKGRELLISEGKDWLR